MTSRDLTRKPLRGPRICDGCGTCYNRFRCGHSFGAVKSYMWRADEDSRKWRNRRRHGVLGFWRQLKSAEWNHHVDACATHRQATEGHTC